MNRRQLLSAAAAAGAPLSTPQVLRGADAPRRIPIGSCGVTHSHGPVEIKLAMKSLDWDCVMVATMLRTYGMR